MVSALITTLFGGQDAMGQAIPATAFVDRDGKIVFRILGQLRDGEVEARLDWLLGDRSGPAPEALVSHLDAGH